MGHIVARWFSIFPPIVTFPCISSWCISQGFIHIFDLLCLATILNFFMRRIVFLLLHDNVREIRLCPYQGCVSWTERRDICDWVSFTWSFEVYWNHDRAIQKRDARSLLFKLFSSLIRSRTKSIFFIFFFHAIDYNGHRSYYLEKVFFFSLEFMNLCKVLRICFSCSTHFWS
jgi:hypothetical protein